MTCEEALILISGHLDGENTQAEEAQLREHLEQCAACRALLQTMKQNDEALRSLHEAVPADLRTHVMDAIRQERAPRRRPWHRWTGLAVAAALVLVIGAASWQPAVEQDLPVVQSRSAAEGRPEAASYAMVEADPEADMLQSLAEERKALIVVLETLPADLEQAPCEQLEDGSALYTLDHAAQAEELSRTYGLPLYVPEATTEAAYALLRP